MKRIIITAIITSLFTSLLAGCNNVSDANEKNFTSAISDHLSKNGDVCLNIRTWPVYLFARDLKLKGVSPNSAVNKMEALESEGLVKSSEEVIEQKSYFNQESVKMKVKSYSLTDNAKPFIKEKSAFFLGAPGHTTTKKPFLCWGKKVLKDIVKWEDPMKFNEHTKAIVTYTYNIKNSAPWSYNKRIRAAFPSISKEYEGEHNRQVKETVYLSNIGWSTERYPPSNKLHERREKRLFYSLRMTMQLKQLIIGGALISVATGANALVCVNCATFTQMAQSNINQAQGYAETLKQTLNQIQSLQNQAESINYQIQNLKNLDIHNWGDAKGQIDRLGRIANQGSAMAYSLVDLNEQWNTQFRGNSKWANEVQTNDMVTQQYREWGDMMQATSKSALQVANEMSTIQSEDEKTITSLQQQSTSAQGAMQVAQAGNEIAAQSTRQLQKMQTLLQTDIQMTATSTALAEEKQAQERAATNAIVTPSNELKTDIHNGKDWTHLW